MHLSNTTCCLPCYTKSYLWIGFQTTRFRIDLVLLPAPSRYSCWRIGASLQRSLLVSIAVQRASKVNTWMTWMLIHSLWGSDWCLDILWPWRKVACNGRFKISWKYKTRQPSKSLQPYSNKHSQAIMRQRCQKSIRPSFKWITQCQLWAIHHEKPMPRQNTAGTKTCLVPPNHDANNTDTCDHKILYLCN